MGDQIEVELKLAVADDDVAALLAADWVRAATPATIPLAATYFDTPARALAAAGFVLRIRREGDAVVQTVKAVGEGAAGLFARPEWNCALPPDRTVPRLDAAAGPLAEMIDATALAALAPTFTTAVQRIEARIARDDGVAKLAVDRGSVVAGDRREPLCEVELELVAGPPAMLFALARAIDALVPARLGVLSKAERGHRLAAGGAPGAVRAEPIALAPEISAGAAFAAIAHACLRQFRLNEDAFGAGDDPAMLHQARVGLRRLRSAMSLFRPLLADDPLTAHHRAALRWLQRVLGDARDIDVLIARIGDRGDDAARLALARADAYAAVAAALASPRTRALLLDLAEWLATGAWRTQAAAAQPVETIAAAILDSQRRRVARRGRKLARLDDERRHDVRIETKKLRYAVEFFAALYPRGKAARRHRKFAVAVEALQDALGTLNDIAAAPALVERLGIAPPPAIAADRDALLADAAEAWEELVDAKRFWR